METIPEDVKNDIIYGYVKDLLFLEHKKSILRKLANDAFQEFKERFSYKLEYFLDDLYYAEDYVNIGKYEEDYGPSGDYGNYVCQSMITALKDYKNVCDEWNAFVNAYKPLSENIVPEMYKDVFKEIHHDESYWKIK